VLGAEPVRHPIHEEGERLFCQIPWNRKGASRFDERNRIAKRVIRDPVDHEFFIISSESKIRQNGTVGSGQQEVTRPPVFTMIDPLVI
jgi:hypothetical protein